MGYQVQHLKYIHHQSWEYFHCSLWQNKWPFPFTNVKKPELLFFICLFKTHFVESFRNFNVESFNRKINLVTTLQPSSKIMTMANLQISVHVAQLKLICGRGSFSQNISCCRTVCKSAIIQCKCPRHVYLARLKPRSLGLNGSNWAEPVLSCWLFTKLSHCHGAGAAIDCDFVALVCSNNCNSVTPVTMRTKEARHPPPSLTQTRAQVLGSCELCHRRGWENQIGDMISDVWGQIWSQIEKARIKV